MIFLHPPLERLDHIFAEHLPFRSSFITAARAIEERSVWLHTVEISRHRTLETCCGSVGRMVIYHVQNNPDARLVKSLHHLLELLNAYYRIIWISRERTLDSIVVERLIAPVVLIIFQTGLVDGRKISRRKQLYICHPYFLEMIYTCGKTIRICRTTLSQGKVFSFIGNTRSRMDREIPVLEFIHDDV